MGRQNQNCLQIGVSAGGGVVKLWAKLTLMISLIVVSLFSVGGYLIIQKSFDFAMSQIIRQYQMQHTDFRIFMEGKVYEDAPNFDDSLQKLCEAAEFAGSLNSTALYTDEEQELYVSYRMNPDADFMHELTNLEDGYRIKTLGDRQILGIVSTFIIENRNVYFITTNDISDVFVQRAEQYRQALLLNMSLLICVVIGIWIFSKHMTRPLERLTQTSQKIAAGAYKERTNIKTNGEVGALAESFDKMAEAVEEKVNSLEQAVRSREDFVANFSHELKTPMTAIMGYADMLRSHENSPEVQIKAADYIYKESKRMSELSMKLMDLMGLSDEYISIEQTAAQNLKTDMGDRVVWDMQPATILVDKTLMVSVLKNLCRNAEKAEASEILIKGRIKENQYEIVVHDNGKGISEEDISRIKEPFYMADKSHTRTYDGFGLGLALCERILHLHGTSLMIKSEIEVSTTIRFELPLNESDKKI
jgi:signal transduction histidine kinase